MLRRDKTPTGSVLRERVSFEKPVSAPNGRGGTYASWETVFTAPAGIRYLRGSEAVVQGRLAGRNTAVVTVRRSSASQVVTPEWRLTDQKTGTLYNIRSIIPTDDGRWLELTCESGVAI